MNLSHFYNFIGHGDSLRRQLMTGSAGSAFVQISSQMLLLASGIFLARTLGADGYGVYSYAMAWLALFTVFAGLGFPSLITREIAANKAQENWSKLKGLLIRVGNLLLVINFILMVLAAAILWIFVDRIPTEQHRTLLWVLLLLPMVVFSRCGGAILIGLKHVVKGELLEKVLRPIIFLTAVFALFITSPGIRLPENAMAIQVATAFFMLGVMMALVFWCLPKQVHTARPAFFETRPLLTSALSLTILSSAALINSQTDILMLGFFRPPADLGVYRVAAQGAFMASFGLQVINVVIAPHIAQLHSQGNYDVLQNLITKSARTILILAVPATLVLILAGGQLAGWIFGSEFSRCHNALAILSFGLLINIATGPVGLLFRMTGHESVSARIMIIFAGANVALNLALIPPFGIVGAASATAISMSLSHIVLCLFAKKRLGIRTSAFVCQRYCHNAL